MSSQSEKLKKGPSPVIPNPTPVTSQRESSTMEASQSLALTPELLLAAYGVFMQQQDLQTKKFCSRSPLTNRVPGVT
jgi:hypothetical protein